MDWKEESWSIKKKRRKENGEEEKKESEPFKSIYEAAWYIFGIVC